jgi:tRNA(Ile)-lysidine synthetase-like protein
VVARRERKKEREGEKSVLIKWSGESLTIRNRRPGDVYRTSLDAEGKKLKELFQKNKIPKSQRDKLVIVEGNNEIIWVEGFPAPPKYRASRSNARTVEIQVRNETSDGEKLLKEGEKNSKNETSPGRNA